MRVGGSISGSIKGGDGSDELIGPNATNTWSLTGTDEGTLNGTTDYTSVENVTGGDGADTFNVGIFGAVSGVLDGGLPRAVSGTTEPADDTLDFSLRTSAVAVNLALGTATSILALSRINVVIGSASAEDTLTGPGEASTDPAVAGDRVRWTIIGANSGEVEGTSFRSFENLTGRGVTSDRFEFDPGGSLSGLLSGGTGDDTIDGFGVDDGSFFTVFLPTSAGEDETTIAGRTIRYAGMDSYTPKGGDDDNRTIRGSIFDDDIVLQDADTAGMLKVTFDGLLFMSNGEILDDDYFTFAIPEVSLKIEGGSGGDTITVKSLDPAFAADLLLYGNRDGDPTIEPDPARDEVRFEGDTETNDGYIGTHGGYLEAFADNISVAAGTVLSTLVDDDDLTTGNDIVFRARRIGTPEIENLLPVGLPRQDASRSTSAPTRSCAASSIYLIAQAEDRALEGHPRPHDARSRSSSSTRRGLPHRPVALPVKVLIKASEAKVTIGEDAQLLADIRHRHLRDCRRLTRPVRRKGKLFSIGYSQAGATATIEIQAGVTIDGQRPGQHHVRRQRHRRHVDRDQGARSRAASRAARAAVLRGVARRVLGRASPRRPRSLDGQHPRRAHRQHPRAGRDGV